MSRTSLCFAEGSNIKGDERYLGMASQRRITPRQLFQDFADGLSERLEKLMFIVYFQLARDDTPTHDGIAHDRKFQSRMREGLKRLERTCAGGVGLETIMGSASGDHREHTFT